MLEADERCIGLGPTVDAHGEGALSDPSRLSDTARRANLGFERRVDDAALQRALTVDAKDEHRSRLLAERSNEAGHQTALNGLLGEDQEDQESDGTDQESEANARSPHLAERQEQDRTLLAPSSCIVRRRPPVDGLHDRAGSAQAVPCRGRATRPGALSVRRARCSLHTGEGF